jgi:hypothetical protein
MSDDSVTITIAEFTGLQTQLVQLKQDKYDLSDKEAKAKRGMHPLVHVLADLYA